MMTCWSQTYLDLHREYWGIDSPSQTMISPSNGEIIYDTTNVIVSSPQDIQLLDTEPDASDYVLFCQEPE